MYAVSDEFLTAVQENARTYYWSGTITTTAGKTYTFDYQDIVKGSGYVTSKCCSSSEIELGTVYAAEMGITLYSDVDRYTLEDATVELFYHLKLADETYETVPMGIFEVAEANRTSTCLELTAYDYMLRFDKDFTSTDSTGTAWGFISLCCTACSVECAHTQEEIETMANGNITLSIYSENDIETYRDVLYYVAQVLGGFFAINRSGQLELRKYGTDAVMEIESKHRFSSSFSDFITRYTAVSSTNLLTETAEYYALETDDGLTMNLGANPLLQFGLEATREKICRNILDDLQAVNYVPFDSDTIGNPALDLGDVLVFSGGQADEEQVACITSFNCKIGGKMTLKCVGKNPRLSQAKSKNDKNISGLLSQVDAAEIAVNTYTNATAYTIGEKKTEVISIEFAASQETNAEFIAQVLITVAADEVTRSAIAEGTITIPDSSGSSTGTDDSDSTDESGDDTSDSGTDTATGTEISVSIPVTWTEDGEALVYVTYELNDFEITTFYPVETWHSGQHILTLYYPISGITANVLNTFKVYLRMDGGTGTVEIGGCLAVITGQALGATYSWDGTLTFEEEYTPFSIGGAITPRIFSEEYEYSLDALGEYEYEESTTRFSIGAFATPVDLE
ncbi:MAG: hypothetical protein LUD12_01635 [Lachnospiraceae bacterium]|nr:hypothetical protein [Lachnospiraceae bacterium]